MAAILSDYSNLRMHQVPAAGFTEEPRNRANETVADMFNFDVDDTPKIVAAIGFGAILTLFLIRRAGFNFVFGTRVGVGR